ncbi:MAG: 5'-nucleotidase C-terminal domain-containing protein [Prevotella sp.]|nr:5'-nucleotidase C-terminal domain-containing protein [Prevotella sp.]
MNKKKTFFSLLAASTLLLGGCTPGYQVASVKKERLLVDNRYDAKSSSELDSMMAPYAAKVDSLMSPVVGKVKKSLKVYRPESELSNLLADILVWASDRYGERPVMGVYNMGGIRASLSEGDVKYGDILEVAPFENKICFLTLSGAHLLELFRQMASVGGEGVSKGVELVFTHDRQLKSARLHGEEIVPLADYRIVTIDYLAQGNDRMEAFKQKRMYNAPSGPENNSRMVILEYFQTLMKQGKTVDANVEGRIIVEEE